MSKPMTKTQLVAALSEEMGTDKKSAGAALDAICGLITREVSGGGAITLPGVGKIMCRARPESCLLYTSPSPRDGLLSRMPSSA